MNVPIYLMLALVIVSSTYARPQGFGQLTGPANPFAGKIIFLIIWYHIVNSNEHYRRHQCLRQKYKLGLIHDLVLSFH